MSVRRGAKMLNFVVILAGFFEEVAGDDRNSSLTNTDGTDACLYIDDFDVTQKPPTTVFASVSSLLLSF